MVCLKYLTSYNFIDRLCWTFLLLISKTPYVGELAYGFHPPTKNLPCMQPIKAMRLAVLGPSPRFEPRYSRVSRVLIREVPTLQFFV